MYEYDKGVCISLSVLLFLVRRWCRFWKQLIHAFFYTRPAAGGNFWKSDSMLRKLNDFSVEITHLLKKQSCCWKIKNSIFEIQLTKISQLMGMLVSKHQIDSPTSRQKAEWVIPDLMLWNVVMNENDQIFSAEDRKKLGPQNALKRSKMGSKRWKSPPQAGIFGGVFWCIKKSVYKLQNVPCWVLEQKVTGEQINLYARP